ncbi:CGNR zinc finger domain-containing protein [Nocardia sp. NPDC052566]|uniref:CGNR zinc finger domain-containing protein n=1 Tax=Nocardia sp. NPDC052566 TaxID=3364330 RepID=UPI0037C9F36C
MTDQVLLGSHTLGVVDDGVALVNVAVPGERRGKPYPPAADTEELRQRLDSVIFAAYGYPVRLEEARDLARAADQIRQIFGAVAAGDTDDAAARINAMITEYHARPELIRRDDQPWRLHFHSPDASRVSGIAAAVAVGLAFVLSSAHADRIGVCSAANCDRVYLDTSRNGTRRFCSTACQNRSKTAAFRARQATEG